MQTTSRIHVVTNINAEKTAPDKKYEDFHGRTRNDMLSLVTLQSYDLKWNLPLRENIAVHAHVDLSRRVANTDRKRKLKILTLIYMF